MTSQLPPVAVVPMPPATVMRRALIAWGLGHVALGDRRGWILLALELASLTGIAVLAADLATTGRWVIVFVLLSAFLIAWGVQAVDAHGRAVRLGGEASGAGQLLALAPIAIVIVTGFWLAAGTSASPASVVQRYVSAWQNGRPELAVGLFSAPPSEGDLTAAWERDTAFLRQRLTALAGAADGSLDATRPFESLRFEYGATSRDAETAIVEIHIVRQVAVDATLFGLFPTASHEMRTVARAGIVTLRAVSASRLLPRDPAARSWRIEAVALEAASPP